jgi:hypothetical protein
LFVSCGIHDQVRFGNGPGFTAKSIRKKLIRMEV